MLRKVIRQELDCTPALTDRTSTSITSTAIHERVICDGCGCNPILGIRYKCYISPDFDYCETCEATKPHPYPFIKIRDPETWVNPHALRPQDRVVELDIDFADIPALIGNGFELIKQKIASAIPAQAELLKAKISDDTMYTGQESRIIWKLRNNGVVPIPAGTTISMADTESTLTHETPQTGEIAPGEKFTLGMNFLIPTTPDHYTTTFTLITPDGTVFGPELGLEFTCEDELQIPEEYKESVEILQEMGFSVAEAVEKIAAAQGDIGWAISMMAK